MKTQIGATDSPNDRRQAVARAVDLLRAGEVVALPTETVYGLAADALSAEAVVKIFETKKRPHFDPLIVHLPELDWLERVAVIDEKERPLDRAIDREILARSPDDRSPAPGNRAADRDRGPGNGCGSNERESAFRGGGALPSANRSRRRAQIASDASARPRRAT